MDNVDTQKQYQNCNDHYLLTTKLGWIDWAKYDKMTHIIYIWHVHWYSNVAVRNPAIKLGVVIWTSTINSVFSIACLMTPEANYHLPRSPNLSHLHEKNTQRLLDCASSHARHHMRQLIMGCSTLILVRDPQISFGTASQLLWVKYHESYHAIYSHRIQLPRNQAASWWES